MASKSKKAAAPADPPRPAGGRGGRRPGSGRKPKEIARLREDFRTIAEQTIAGWMPGLLRNVKKLADGFGDEPPDFRANAYLLDRLLGRPGEAPEVAQAAADLGAALDQADAALEDFREPEPDDDEGPP